MNRKTQWYIIHLSSSVGNNTVIIVFVDDDDDDVDGKNQRTNFHENNIYMKKNIKTQIK